MKLTSPFIYTDQYKRKISGHINMQWSYPSQSLKHWKCCMPQPSLQMNSASILFFGNRGGSRQSVLQTDSHLWETVNETADKVKNEAVFIFKTFSSAMLFCILRLGFITLTDLPNVLQHTGNTAVGQQYDLNKKKIIIISVVFLG